MLNKSERLSLFSKVDVYPVITEEFCANRSSIEVCRRVLAGGARIVQFREKHKSKKEIAETAKVFRQLTWNARALLIINDHVDIAMTVQADGVHLGQDDLPVSVARNLLKEVIIGVSTHNLVEAKLAEIQGADYINIGPIYSTQTKHLSIPPLGLEIISQIKHAIQIPFTVMGGIKKNNIQQVVTEGASKVAMVTELTQAEDVESTVRWFVRQIRSGWTET